MGSKVTRTTGMITYGRWQTLLFTPVCLTKIIKYYHFYVGPNMTNIGKHSSHLDVLLGLCLPENCSHMQEQIFYESTSHSSLPQLYTHSMLLMLVWHTHILYDLKHNLLKLSISYCRLKQALCKAAGLSWTRKVSLS